MLRNFLEVLLKIFIYNAKIDLDCVSVFRKTYFKT